MAPTWHQLGSLGAVLAPPWHLGCKMSSKQPASQSHIFSNLFQRFLQISRETPKNLPKWAPDASKCFKNGPQITAKIYKKLKAINKKASTRASEQQSKPSQAKAKDKAKTEAKALAPSQRQAKPTQAKAISFSSLALSVSRQYMKFGATWGQVGAKLGP